MVVNLFVYFKYNDIILLALNFGGIYMSLDGMVTSAIVDELRSTIIGGRVDKIYQYDKNEILINIYNQRKNNKLIVSASPNSPRIHLTNHTISNPSTPPMFCMLLRKHLMGGIVLNVEQHDTDRIIFVDISSIDDLGESVEKRLAIEIMGRHSNIILIDKETDKIIDSIRRITHNISRVRQVLPGIEYEYPKTDGKLNPLYLNKKEFCKLLDEGNRTTKTYKFFYSTYLGLGPLIGKEICFLSGIDYDKPVGNLTPREKESLFDAFVSIIDIIKAKKFKPVLIQNPSTDKYQTFYAIDIKQFRSYNKVYINSISKALDIYYRKNIQLNRISQLAQSIKKDVQTALNRSLNKLSKQKHELLESRDRKKYKVYADLISANIYRIDKGMEKIELENFYSETMEKIIIPLDKKLSPALNAQRYYKKYSKLKNAHSLLSKQIPDTKAEIEYLENVLISIDNCTEPADLEEIEEELVKESYLKNKGKRKRRKTKTKPKPHHYISSDGLDIYIGKNNRQNDYLTLRFAHREDLWLHAQNMPGSHVIVRRKNNEVPHTTLEEAALLAAYYSKGRHSTNVPIDYTKRKNVRKPKNARTGMVIYDDFNTLFVTPDKKQINRIKKVDI